MPEETLGVALGELGFWTSCHIDGVPRDGTTFRGE
jgi:hypothetical protein